MLFRKALRSWLQDKSERVAELTGLQIENRAEAFWFPRWGQRTVRSITAQDIRAYFSERLRGDTRRPIKESTLNCERAWLANFFRWALTERIVKENPLARVPPFRMPTYAIRTFRDDEVERIFAALPEWLRRVATFALETGLRRGTILSLRWKHFDVSRGWLVIPPQLMKARVEHDCPLSADAIVAMGVPGDPEALIFPAVPRSVTVGFARRCRRLGIRGRFHDLKRTFFSRAKRRGVPLETAMRLAGNRELKVVLRIYRAIEESELLRAVGR